MVTAFNVSSGDRVWQVELSKDDDDEGILGGGLAFEDGRVFATTDSPTWSRWTPKPAGRSGGKG